jgi:hypothetical protein
LEERFGEGATELDALKHPGALERNPVPEIRRYYDLDLQAGTDEVAEELLIDTERHRLLVELMRLHMPSGLALNQQEHRAAGSTVEALMLGLRERGVAALGEPGVQRRLSELSEKQLLGVSERLQKLESHVAWTAADVEILVYLWTDVHG